MIDYTLTRSNRKTIAIYIRNGVVEVRAPLKATKKDIENFLLSKDKLIEDRLVISEKQAKSRESFKLDYGDTALYLGNEYPIAAKPGNLIGFDNCFYMPEGLPPEEIRAACVQIYRLLAKRDLSNRVWHFSEMMSVSVNAVRINGAKTRWGSCSSQKSLNFSWRLIMADSDVVDYVVVHELAHITEMNHSQKFWSIVNAVLPDYHERKRRLRELNLRLANEDWEN